MRVGATPDGIADTSAGEVENAQFPVDLRYGLDPPETLAVAFGEVGQAAELGKCIR